MPKKKKRSYKETLNYLFTLLPMYQNVGKKAMKKDLKNIVALCKHLGNPDQKFPSIHIAGTNGKGSTTHILAAILQQKGKKVGVYTSPHYRDFRERIKINKQLVSESFVVDFVEENQKIINKIKPSFFEITVAMAFAYFADKEVDIAVIETGLGGRLDSTNIINPLLSIITNISLDHTDMLGNTLKEIASEKAGIIKQGVPVVVGEYHKETASIFNKKAKELLSPIYFASQHFTTISTVKALTHSIFNVYKNKRLYIKDLETDLAGKFQAHNFTTIIQAIEVLNEQGFGISEKDILISSRRIASSTLFIGRMQTLGYHPFTLLDSGHNEGALSKTIQEITKRNFEQIHFVLGFVKDKDISKLLKFFPKNGKYYFTQADIPRALPAKELGKEAKKFKLKGKVYETVAQALEQAQSEASLDDMIFVGGSTFVVAEVV